MLRVSSVFLKYHVLILNLRYTQKMLITAIIITIIIMIMITVIVYTYVYIYIHTHIKKDRTVNSTIFTTNKSGSEWWFHFSKYRPCCGFYVFHVSFSVHSR